LSTPPIEGLLMGSRISVGTSYARPAFIVPLAGAGVLLGIGAVCHQDRSAALFLFSGGGLGLLVAAIVWGTTYSGRRWLEVTPEGFVVSGPGVSRACSDGDVRRLGFSLRRNFQSGLPKSLTCRLALWLGDDRDRIELRYTQGLGEKSDFAKLAERLFENLCRRSREALARGEEIAGEGWSLRRGTLEVDRGGRRETIPVETVAAVGEFDSQVRVWRRGENEAMFQVPAGSANAGILQRLLGELLPPPEASPRTASGDDLGKVLFERRGGSGAWLGWFVAGTLVPIGLLLLAGGGFGIGAALAGAGLLCGAATWWSAGTAFRCHENGVMRRTRKGERQIRYRDVSAFTYKAVRHFTNGVYTGTTVNLQFVSLPALGSERIAHGASFNGMDEELSNLRDHISKVIGIRMAEELQSGKDVPWTPNLRLLPGGIEYRPSGLFGRKDAEVVPYSQVTSIGLDKGFFHLWVRGRDKSVMQEPVWQPNFFPGYLVLSSLLRPAESAGEGAGSV
jgi:hypothetical protein